MKFVRADEVVHRVESWYATSDYCFVGGRGGYYNSRFASVIITTVLTLSNLFLLTPVEYSSVIVIGTTLTIAKCFISCLRENYSNVVQAHQKKWLAQFRRI